MSIRRDTVANPDEESPYRPDDADETGRRLRVRAAWRKEPVLAFAGGRWHVDAKTGIARFGPASLGLSRHPSTIRLGFVGSGRSVASARALLDRISVGIRGDPVKRSLDFPGFAADRGFFSELSAPSDLEAIVTTNDIAALKKINKVADRFDAAVALVSDRMKLLTTQDDRPRLVVLALPTELVEMTSKVKFNDPAKGLVFRNFRRALKAELMRHQVPTQIILERVSEAEAGDKKVDHPSRIAWNLMTSMFFKGGGIPWKPVGLRPDTCYVGVSFHRPLGSNDHTLRSSVAQAFDENGVGLVLRGPDFQWDSRKDGPSPHMNADQAKALLELVLARYTLESKHLPARVVIHKTSRFWDAEREGFQDALSGIRQFDLVSVSPTSEIRLVRSGNYPPLRGTLFSVGDIAYLYTTGYIPALKAYPHGHVPAPIQIADHHGDSSVEDLADEILILTKMNWNSAGFSGALPITIRFSRQVGDIMREIPDGREPMPQFAFYT